MKKSTKKATGKWYWEATVNSVEGYLICVNERRWYEATTWIEKNMKPELWKPQGWLWYSFINEDDAIAVKLKFG